MVYERSIIKKIIIFLLRTYIAGFCDSNKNVK